MPAGNMVFSGMKSSSGGKSVWMSACRGTRTGGKTEHTHTQERKLTLSPQKSIKLVSYTKLIMEANSLWITRSKTTVWLTWCLYTLVVVRVHTHLVLLHMEGKLAQVYSTQLVVGLQVRPAPQPAVDHMGKAFSVRYLQTAIQRPAQNVQGDNETTGPIKVTN